MTILSIFKTSNKQQTQTNYLPTRNITTYVSTNSHQTKFNELYRPQDMSLLLLPPPLQCTRCNLPNCNSERHRATMPFVYPVCSTCGIELNDLIELYKNPALRCNKSCEICFKCYKPDDDFYDHFNVHFSKVAARSTATKDVMLCISCCFNTEVTQKKDLPYVVIKPVAKITLENRSYIPNALQCLPPLLDAKVSLTRLSDSQIPSSTQNLKIELADEGDDLVLSSPSSFGYAEDTNDDNNYDSLSDPFSCSSEQTAAPLSIHSKPFVETTQIPNVDGKFSCSLCEYSVLLRRNLMHHERVKHNINNESELPVGCPKCPRRFEEIRQLKWHQSRFHRVVDKLGRQIWKCRACDLPPFSSAQKREDHENCIHLNAESNRWSCRSCTMSFLKPSDLRCHEFGHTGIRPYVCEKCGFSTKRKEHIERHMDTHTDDRPVICDICPEKKSFKSITSLKVHITYFHQRKHKFPCDKCDRVFRYHSDRRRHLRSHGGVEKKFSCVLCEKRFYEPKDLRLHMKSH